MTLKKRNLKFLVLVFIFNNKPFHTTLCPFEVSGGDEVILLFYIIYIYTREHNGNFWKPKWYIKRKSFFLCLLVSVSNLESLQLKAAVDSWNTIVTDVRNKIAFLRVSREVFLE